MDLFQWEIPKFTSTDHPSCYVTKLLIGHWLSVIDQPVIIQSAVINPSNSCADGSVDCNQGLVSQSGSNL